MKFLRILLIAIVTATTLTRTEGTALAVNLPLDQLAVPHYDTWVQLPSAVIQELRLLVDGPQAEINRLLSSPDAREVGLGLFALEQNGDLVRLVSLVDLLDDSRPTIPFAAPTAGPDQFVPLDQTVGQYLSHIYGIWFGIPGFSAWSTASAEVLAARKEEIRNIADPWGRPVPWGQKMSRASNSVRYWNDTSAARDQRMAAVKLEVRQIPSDVRWAVIMDARDSGYYSREDARSELLLLDQTVRDQLVAGGILETHTNAIGWDLSDKELGAKCRDLLLNAN